MKKYISIYCYCCLCTLESGWYSIWNFTIGESEPFFHCNSNIRINDRFDPKIQHQSTYYLNFEQQHHYLQQIISERLTWLVYLCMKPPSLDNDVVKNTGLPIQQMILLDLREGTPFAHSLPKAQYNFDATGKGVLKMIYFNFSRILYIHQKVLGITLIK